MVTVLVVEDDAQLRELYCAALSARGYAPCAAADGLEALAAVEAARPSLVVCDVMMPNMDGIELARRLRREGRDLPILMITAKGELADKREGFRAGVDDYVVKPVDIDEMIWRIEALLRRARIATEHRLQIGRTVLDAEALSVRRGDEEQDLPQKEFNLLFKLLASPGRVFTRRQLLDDVWGSGAPAGEHTLDVHISRLRERFRENPDFQIVTVRGLGYKGVRTDGRG